MSIVNFVLMLGAKGLGVSNLQLKLIEYGYNLIADGFFGSNTEKAVKDFQKDKNLTVDGIVGSNTRVALFKTKDELEEDERFLNKVSKSLNIELPVLKAIMEVESQGEGFLEDGRPVILFERHWMFRLLEEKEGFNPFLYEEICPGVVNRKHGYYLGGANAYEKLKIAKAIDEDSALASCSWGLFQIMGFHWKKLGFKSVKYFVKEMEESLEKQIYIFTLFIKADNRLHTAAINKDWVTFANIYNGPKHLDYDKKLEEAYLSFKD